MAELNEKGIHLRSISDGIDTSTPNGRFLFTIMSAMAQLEAEMISQRTKDALAITDKKLGRPRISKTKVKKLVQLYNYSQLTVKEIAFQEDVSVSFVYKLMNKKGYARRINKDGNIS